MMPMRVTVLQEHLDRGLAIAVRAVAARGTMPSLTHVLVRAQAGALTLVATNLDIAISCRVPARVDEDGAIALPARLVLDLVASLRPGPIELRLNVRTKALQFKSPPYESHIKGIEAEEFPIIPRFPAKAMARLTQDELLRMINEVAFAAATDDNRPVLAGVATRFSVTEMKMAASDGYRLAVRRCDVLFSELAEVEAIVPARSLLELARLLKPTDDEVEIAFGPQQSQLLFRIDDIEMVTRIIDGTYVNYAPLIPTSHGTRAVLSRTALLEAVRVASFFARDVSNIIQLELFPGEDQPLVVSAVSSETGSNVGRLDATVDGPRVRVGFNSRYMAEALASGRAEEISLELNGPLAPCVLRPMGDDRYVHVLMPIRMAS
jgi:DNA polymerase-3 subunit beta